MAAANIYIDGVRPQVAAHTYIEAPTAAQQEMGVVGNATANFKTFNVDNNQGISIPRDQDAEVKIIDYVDQQLAGSTTATGYIDLFTELIMCPSCDGVKRQFEQKYGGRVIINVLDNEGKRLIPPKNVQ